MALLIGKVCPGVKNRTGAYIAAAVAIALGLILVIAALLGMVFTYRESKDKVGRRNDTQKEMVLCYYGAGFALWGTWMLFSIFLIAGIKAENKRTVGLWLVFVLMIPIYFIVGIAYMFAVGLVGPWEIAYFIVQGIAILALIWICLAVWIFLGEIRLRDKNPEMRENEQMLTTPFGMMMPPAGTYNPGYGGPGGSMSSIPRSQKSRMTYAPTETESIKTVPTIPRQSRLDQYRAQQVVQEPTRERSPERDGGTTYYRYEYTAEGKYNGSTHGSQASLSRVNPQPSKYTGSRHGSQASLSRINPQSATNRSRDVLNHEDQTNKDSEV